YLHIQISGEADDALAARVAAAASDLTARRLGKDPALTAVVIDFIPAARWFIGGRRLGDSVARSYHWMVSITDETNTKPQKADY
ncbi:tautomerase family protein, partial [Klebsiella pneumoniae]